MVPYNSLTAAYTRVIKNYSTLGINFGMYISIKRSTNPWEYFYTEKQ